MQISFRHLGSSVGKALALACLGLTFSWSGRVHCDPYASVWANSARSSVRLIAAGDGLAGGSYHAGAQIRLDPQALTYWRTPGAAGVPPSFSFDGSENTASVRVSYPVPARIDEDGSDVYGYQGGVTFPLEVAPSDPNRPVHLVLNLSYAVCSKICLPAKGEATVTLEPRSASTSEESPELAAARALVPLQLTPDQGAARVAITPVAKSGPAAWHISLCGGSAEDIFAEAPSGWYFETKKTSVPNEFLLVEVDRPKTAASARPAVTLTVKGEPHSFEFEASLSPAPILAGDAHSLPVDLSNPGQN